MSNQETLLRVEELTKKFGSITALDHVNFTLHAGEIKGLAGHNGAGKSVLVKIIGGIFKQDAGKIYFNEKEVKLNSPHDAQELGYHVVPQELNLARQLTVADNVFIGRNEVSTRIFKVTRRKFIREESEKLIKEYFNIDVNGDTLVENLDTVTQRIIQVVRCLRAGAKIIVFDETTAGLTRLERQKLFVHIKTLSQKGIGIIFISHMISEIMSICMSLTVLREGKAIGTHNVCDLDSQRVIEMITGKEHLKETYEKSPIRDEIILSVRELSTENNGISNIDLDLYKGEVFGIYGLRDQGQTLMLETISRAHRKAKGSIKIAGKALEAKTISTTMKNGLAYLPERGLKTVFDSKTILENVSVSYMNLHEKTFQIKRAVKADLFEAMLKKVNLRGCSSLNVKITNLSGGNRQKVLLSRLLAINPDVLMIVEPMLGIDIGAKDEIRKIILDIARQGKTVIISTAEIDDIIQICNRVAIVREGKLMGILDASEANKALIINESTRNVVEGC